MELLTRPARPKPQPRKRRGGEICGSFKRAAGKMMRRVFRAVHLPPAMWDTLTWFRQWEFEDTASPEDIGQDCARPGDAQEASELSHHL
jgi:hypothetical protein